MKNIVLGGFMGCGKTTVGRLLAEQTGRRFVDMDAAIEEAAGMPVSAIFAQFGEDDFRRREREMCRELASRSDLVIATGGGALTFPANVEVLAATGTIVLLDVSAQTVLARLEGDTSRPLLMRPDKERAVQELMAARRPLYAQAASVCVSGEGDPAAVAEAIRACCDA